MLTAGIRMDRQNSYISLAWSAVKPKTDVTVLSVYTHDQTSDCKT